MCCYLHVVPFQGRRDRQKEEREEGRVQHRTWNLGASITPQVITRNIRIQDIRVRPQKNVSAQFLAAVLEQKVAKPDHLGDLWLQHWRQTRFPKSRRDLAKERD